MWAPGKTSAVNSAYLKTFYTSHPYQLWTLQDVCRPHVILNRGFPACCGFKIHIYSPLLALTGECILTLDDKEAHFISTLKVLWLYLGYYIRVNDRIRIRITLLKLYLINERHELLCINKWNNKNYMYFFVISLYPCFFLHRL